MNNLSQRERTLLIMVIATIPIVALYFGWSTYQGMYSERTTKLAAATLRLDELKTLERNASEEADRMEVYNASSLSYDAMNRAELYSNYLLSLVSESGLQLENNNSGTLKLDEVLADDLDPDKGPLYHRVRVSEMKLRGDMQQLTRFLYSFYDAAILQRIDNITILQDAKKEEDTELSITMTVSGLVLSGAADHRNFADYGSGRTGKTFDEFADLIVARNVFGPPNEAPTFSSGQLSQDLEVGDALRISNFSANDTKGEQLRFEILESDVEGVSLEQRDGSNTARIKGPVLDKPGKYRVKVRVADNRIPQLSEEETIVFNVEEKEERVVVERPKKKVAPETYITSMFQNSAGEQIVRIKNEDDRFELKQDETFELDDATWKVVTFDLARRQVTLLKGEERLVFKLGSTLDQPLEEEKPVAAVTEY